MHTSFQSVQNASGLTQNVAGTRSGVSTVRYASYRLNPNPSGQCLGRSWPRRLYTPEIALLLRIPATQETDLSGGQYARLERYSVAPPERTHE